MKTDVTMVITVFVLSTLGCGNKESINQELTPAQAGSRMQQAFESTDATTRRQVRVLIDALDSDDYDRAYVAIGAVQGKGNLTYDQALAARQAMQTLQERMARAVVRGDAKALEAAKRIRQMQP